MTKSVKENWEYEFHKKFYVLNSGQILILEDFNRNNVKPKENIEAIKQFIQSTLDNQVEEILREIPDEKIGNKFTCDYKWLKQSLRDKYLKR